MVPGGTGKPVVVAALVAALLASGTPARALEGKLGLGLVRLEPAGQDAGRFGGPGWGLSLQLTALLPRTSRMLAGVAGFEFVNLSFRQTGLSGTATDPVPQDPLLVSRQTNQYMSRIYIGPEIGSHGPGGFRPHAGANVALVLYGISVDVAVPDVSDPGSVQQTPFSEHRAAFGYDVTLGLDINPWNTVSFDVGARFVKSFNVPQQLGAGPVTIHPAYIEGYLGVAFALAWLGRHAGH